MGSQELTQPEGRPRSWYRDGYFLTTDKTYLDAQAVNEIFDSDLMWWNRAMGTCTTEKMLENCMAFAIYAVPDTQEEMQANGGPRSRVSPKPKIVGLARLVTDYVTFAYLTDVFVLKTHQRKGLARWMMQGIRETVSPWPHLRGLLLLAGDESAAAMYRQELGAADIQEGPSKGLVVLEMPGKGEVSMPNGH